MEHIKSPPGSGPHGRIVTSGLTNLSSVDSFYLLKRDPTHLLFCLVLTLVWRTQLEKRTFIVSTGSSYMAGRTGINDSHQPVGNSNSGITALFPYCIEVTENYSLKIPYYQSKYEEAETVSRQARSGYEATLGNRHPYTPMLGNEHEQLSVCATGPWEIQCGRQRNQTVEPQR